MYAAYIKVLSEKSSLEEFAFSLKKLLNIADTNLTSYQKEQKRFGLNAGNGEYFLFEVFGLEIQVIENIGEVQYFDSSCKYYLYVESELELDEAIFKSLLQYIIALLKANDILSEIEDGKSF